MVESWSFDCTAVKLQPLQVFATVWKKCTSFGPSFGVTAANESYFPHIPSVCLIHQAHRWEKQINCPMRSGSQGVAGSCHHPPSLIGVYKGHMAWEGGAVPALAALTHKVVLPPVGRRWMQDVDAPALAVPVGSGREKTRQHWLRSLRSVGKDL